mmetsp:Transcript_52749/g.126010  ORF Transcript_52749/g.126010 Transcript_52749/m.126010 type:complete len:210 (+) Transcript_52749:451-1080(+)
MHVHRPRSAHLEPPAADIVAQVPQGVALVLPPQSQVLECVQRIAHLPATKSAAPRCDVLGLPRLAGEAQLRSEIKLTACHSLRRCLRSSRALLWLPLSLSSRLLFLGALLTIAIWNIKDSSSGLLIPIRLCEILRPHKLGWQKKAVAILTGSDILHRVWLRCPNIHNSFVALRGIKVRRRGSRKKLLLLLLLLLLKQRWCERSCSSSSQ